MQQSSKISTLISGIVLLTFSSFSYAEEEKSWWQLTKNYVSESLNIFNEETEEVTTDITEGSKELMGDIKDKSGQLWDKSKEKSKETWQDIKEGSEPAIDKTKEVSNDLLNKAKELVKTEEKKDVI
ncbi:hypothetical protein [Algibacillus agarilyticus]|uniref:hypothetical protein n=1 Tax=Algibacillus agarilyticus TaxID=2234133 RepID=UPI000DD0954E|nr:hypothetical protein [Algibacillus agarilyticus]